jgi:hypothetical protein
MAMFLLFLAIVLSVVTASALTARRKAQRADFIREYVLPRGLFVKLRQRHPQLTLKDCQLVAQALRQFFLVNLNAGRHTVAMPWQVADDLWHEFILHTRNYEVFCGRAFGRFLHHTPATAMGGERRSNEGLRRCWWWACKAENINPREPTRLPLLFAIDGKLAIVGGFRYVPDCGPARAAAGDGGGGIVIHCGGDFSSDSFDGSTDGLGDGGSDGGGDGDGGGGCGN